MRILVISDTHGRDENLEKAVMREQPFDMLIHCGDVEGREFYIEALVECPCTIIAGNNDFFSDLPREEEITIADHKILISHGHLYGVSMDVSGLIDEARSRYCDCVLFGHTHKPVIDKIDGIFVLNPGSLSFPRQRNHKPSYAILNIEKNKDISAEIQYL